MTNRTRADVLLIAGFCAFLFFYGSGQFGLIGADEPRYAQVAREMLERHDVITPTLNGQPWLEKPPLYYWQAMLAYSIFGVTDVAARLPGALDATLLVIAVYLFFRRFRRGVEVDAALITASCAGVIGYAHAASMDMALAASFGIGMLAWWAWIESQRPFYLAAFYFCVGLGMLAKGPVAPVLAAATIAVFALATSQAKLIIRTLRLPGIALFCATTLPWYIAVQLRNPQFFREFILQHNLARFSSNLYHHPQPFWYYLPVTALAFVPWTVFVAAAFVRTVRAWWTERKVQSPEPDFEFRLSLFAACWLIVPLVFFSISRSKLPGYILPVTPAGAILLAVYLRQHIESEESPSKWIVLLHALIASAPLIPALLIADAVTERHLPGGRPMLIALAIAFALCAAIALTLVSRRSLRMLPFITLIPVVLSVAAVIRFGATAIDQTLSTRPLAHEIAATEMHPLPLAVFGVPREIEYGLNFYRNQQIIRYETGSIPPQEHLLVARENLRLEIAKKTEGRRVSFLGHYATQHVDYYWISAGPM